MEKEFLSFVRNQMENVDWKDLIKTINGRSVYIWGGG